MTILNLVTFLEGLTFLFRHALHWVWFGLAFCHGRHGLQVLHQTNSAACALTSALEKTIVDRGCSCRTGSHVWQGGERGVAVAEQVRAGLNLSGAGHADVGAVRHAHLVGHHRAPFGLTQSRKGQNDQHKNLDHDWILRYVYLKKFKKIF